METELLNQLLTDPAHLPFFFLVAATILFAIKIVNKASDELAKHILSEVKQRRGVLAVCKGITQITAIAIIIYVANAMYWTDAIEGMFPSPTEKPISTFTATVELVIQADKTKEGHILDRGGYLLFAADNQEILTIAASDSWRQLVATNECMYRSTLNLDATHAAVGQPVNMLEQAEFVQAEFLVMPKDATLIRGRALCTINSEFRFELKFPAQKAQDGKVLLVDLKDLHEMLK